MLHIPLRWIHLHLITEPTNMFDEYGCFDRAIVVQHACDLPTTPTPCAYLTQLHTHDLNAGHGSTYSYVYSS